MENYTVYMENVTIDSTTEIMAIVQLAYGIPSISLMIFAFFLISFGKRYKNSSFYRLVQFDLLTNILVYLNTWIAIRIEMHPNFVFIVKFVESRLPGLMTWLKYFPYWFFHMHFWTAELLTFHRMTSILFPYNYENFWNRYYPFIFIVICVVSHLPKYIWTGFLYEVYIVNGQLISINFPKTLDTAINVVALFSTIYFVLNIINGVLTIGLASRKIEAATTSKSNIKKKLTLISITYSLVYTAEVVWSVLNSASSYLHFLPPWFTKLNNSLLVFASDMFTLSLPYIMLAFDTNVKKDVCICCKKRPVSNQGTIVFVSQS
ncbi:hypothetical protein CRE_18861 [Caenorhabditis remanei]|uniref:Serpentine receptor class gamma n=1 Tax=Caenorhabditis remanei TaxID=31234 RepID=E3LL81_CAERE|nr:hypothetical protein CRE_18861 [Caenorhabditis remanei]